MYTKQKNFIIIFIEKYDAFYITTEEMSSKFIVKMNGWSADFESDYFSY